MAKKAKKSVFNKSLFFFFVVTALVITVFAVRYAPTNMQQNAAVHTCGPHNTNPACPSGYICSYTAGNPDFGGSCVLILSAPSDLKTSGRCYYYSSTPNPANILTSWSKVENATSYKVYGSYYYGSTLTTFDAYSTENNSFLFGISLPHGVKTFSWHVTAYNSTANIYGPSSTTVNYNFICR